MPVFSTDLLFWAGVGENDFYGVVCLYSLVRLIMYVWKASVADQSMHCVSTTRAGIKIKITNSSSIISTTGKQIHRSVR